MLPLFQESQPSTSTASTAFSFESSLSQKIGQCFVLPQRYFLCMLSCIAVLFAHAIRTSLPSVITYMIKPDNRSFDSNQTCVNLYEETLFTPRNHVLPFYEWSLIYQEIINVAFYVGYIFTHLPAGIFADQIGGKHFLHASLIGSSICCLITPVVLRSSDGSLAAVIALRITDGFFQGAMFPSLSAMLAQWAPESERATMVAVALASSPLGYVASMKMAKIFIKKYGEWSYVFYLFGSLGLVWNVFWYLFGYSRPELNPFISFKERNYLYKNLDVQHGWKKIPWCDILWSGPLWAHMVSEIGQDWGWFTITNQLHIYITQVLRTNVHVNTVWHISPFLSMWVLAIVFGCVSDWFANEGRLNITIMRKICLSLGSFGPASILLFGFYAECDRNVAMLFFIVALSLLGMDFCTVFPNNIDLAPNFAGTLTAITNGVSTAMSILSPTIVYLMKIENTLPEWENIFWVTFSLYVFTCLVFLVFGSGKVQPWNDKNKQRIFP